MLIRIGTVVLGTIETVDGESILTKFLLIGTPLLPMESYYCVGLSKREQAGRNKPQAYAIPLHWKSASIGYLRYYSAIAATLLTLFGLIGGLADGGPARTYFVDIAASIAIIIWCYSFFHLGRLSMREKQQRRMLRLITGLGAAPAILSPEMRATIATQLERRWIATRHATPEHIVAQHNALAVAPATADQLPLLYALKLYQGEERLASEVWTRLEQDYIYCNRLRQEDGSLSLRTHKTAECVYTSRGLQVMVNANDAWGMARKEINFQNFFVETKATYYQGPRNAYYGLFFRSTDAANGYLFILNAEGEYGFWLQQQDEYQALIDWTAFPNIKAGARSTNQIAVHVEGGLFTCHINRQQIAQVRDTTFRQGDVAIVVSAYDQGISTVHFDYLNIWRIS